MNKTLFVLLDHGLGNRIGGLIGGLCAAKIINARPIICWPIDNWCQAEFHDLFESKFELARPEFSMALVDQIQKQQMPYFFVAPIEDSLHMPTYYEISLEELENLNNSNNNKIVYAAAKIPKQFVNKKLATEIISTFKINQNILNVVKEFCEKNSIDRNTIGLHIRKTDTGSMADENEIFNYVKSNPKQKFFLCSDNKETEERFLQFNNLIVFSKESEVRKLDAESEWRDRITAGDREYLFNVDRPKQQIIEAFTDMLILSRTTINRQSRSTFRGIAERFATIEIFNV